MKHFLLATTTVLALSACSSDSTPEAAPSSSPATGTTSAPPVSGQPGEVRELTIKDFAFSPSDLTVPAGTTIRVTNQDSAIHTWTSDGNWDSGDLGKGESFTMVLKEKGTFSYICTPHPSMKGTVTVT